MTRRKTITATAIAALGLSSLSPVQQGTALMAAGAAALWASPALAQNQVPGVGIIVKKKPGNAPIVVPSDANGEVRLAGLEPGLYTVQVFGGAQETPMMVGPDGILAFTAFEDTKRPDPRPGNPAPRALPVVKRWAEQIANSGPCNEPITCNYPRNAIDFNAASAEQIARGTGTSMQSAVQIVALREKGGRYTSIEDFARRNCPTSAIEMNKGVVKIGEATIVLAPASGQPVVPGFQCAPRNGGQFSLYSRSYNYVGHVTLLR